jgi:hypothetical protein
LDELPTTLDDTYMRALECIPKEKWRHAHRLFQCLIAAIRPIRVEELAEMFAIQFDSNTGPNFIEDWRPMDPEDAVLSTCSSLIAIVDVEDSHIVQFSHFSVKEFLTSDRLASLNVGTISHYHIRVEPAHAILVRACLTVLLQLDEKTDKKRLRTFPLAFYAAQHWVYHAKFGQVTLEIEDAIIRLFNPKKTHLPAWTWIHHVGSWYHLSIDDLEEHPSPPSATALYFAAYYGFSWLAKHLIIAHAEDVDSKSGYRTPLLVAYWRHHAAARVLYGEGAQMEREIEDESKTARHDGHLKVMRLLLEHGADIDARDENDQVVLHLASEHGEVDVVQLLLQHNATVNTRGPDKWTPLHHASWYGHIKTTQLLLEYGADVNARSEIGNTPLIFASIWGSVEVVRLLLVHKADVHVRGNDALTAFDLAAKNGHHDVVRLLLEHGAEGKQEGRNE